LKTEAEEINPLLACIQELKNAAKKEIHGFLPSMMNSVTAS
jgi:hypothetical protein